MDAGPGVLLAIALLIFTSSWAGLPLIQFPGTPPPRQQTEVRALQGSVADLEARQAETEAELAQINEAMALARARRQEAEGQPAAGAGQAKAERALEDGWKKLVEIQGRKARTGKELQFKSAALDQKQKELDHILSTRVWTAHDLPTDALNHLVVLGLIGYVLGTLLAPINRLVLVNWADSLLAALPQRLALTLASALALTRGFAYRDEKQKARATLGRFARGEAIEPADLARAEARHRPASFFVGRGVVSQSELDGFVTAYYRWAEVAINLALPLLALGLALSYRCVNAAPPGARCWLIFFEVPGRWCCYLPVLAALVAALLLIALGRRQLYEYREKVATFIAGRLEKLKAEEQEKAKQQEKARTLYDALALAKELLEKHGGGSEAKG